MTTPLTPVELQAADYSVQQGVDSQIFSTILATQAANFTKMMRDNSAIEAMQAQKEVTHTAVNNLEE